MFIPFFHDCNSLNANPSAGWLAVIWDEIDPLNRNGGNLAVSCGINVAQLRLGHQTQDRFNQIISEKFQIPTQSGRYSDDNSVPV